MNVMLACLPDYGFPLLSIAIEVFAGSWKRTLMYLIIPLSNEKT